MTAARRPEIEAILAGSSPEFVAEWEVSEALFLAAKAVRVKVNSLTDAVPVDDGWKLRNWLSDRVSVETYPTAVAAAAAYNDRTATMVKENGR